MFKQAFDVVLRIPEFSQEEGPKGSQLIRIDTEHAYWLIDTVFYDRDMSELDVKRSLINHDGYDDRIVVNRRRVGE